MDKSWFQSSLHDITSRCQCAIVVHLLSWEHFATLAGDVWFEQEFLCCLYLGYRRLHVEAKKASSHNIGRSIETLVLPHDNHIQLVCILTTSAASLWLSLFLVPSAGDVAWNLKATDPWIRHAVPGDGRKVSVCVWGRREGPACVSSASEFCGELCKHLRDLKRKAADI